MLNRILIVLLCSGLLGCPKGNSENTSDKSDRTEMRVEHSNPLVNQVMKAINPKFQNWVLFSNGTYIIFEDVSPSDSLEKRAIEFMKEWGPVYAGGSAGDFGTTTLTKTEGWVVSGHGHGMYTYVHPDKLESDTPSDVEVGLLGRSKRHQDSQEMEIVHTNRAK